MKINLKQSLLKTSLLVLILAAFPYCYWLPLAIIITIGYKYIVALFFGVRVMPTMDMACYYGHENAVVNFTSFTILDRQSVTRMKEILTPVLLKKWKLTAHIKEIFGDLYWKESKDPIKDLEFII